MNCVDYNIVKEGIMRNATSSGIRILSDLELMSLYDGSYDTPALTLSGLSETVSLYQNFGESFDVCFARYYTDETTLATISGSYVTFSGTNTPLEWFLESSGVYRANINSPVADFYLFHTTISGVNTNIFQVDLIPEENSTLGFGTTPSEDIDYFKAEHATTSGLSATANIITLFNDNNFQDVAKVAVAPTFSEEDKYIFISTEISGTYYGIDDYGIGQPAHKKSSLVSDPLTSGTLSDQWRLRSPVGEHIITRNSEGVSFDIGDTRFDQLHAVSSHSRYSTGLLSKDEFTVQSFTAEIKVKLDSYTDFTDTGTANRGRSIMFAITDSFTIPDVGYLNSWTTRDRQGDSTIGLVLADSSTGGKLLSKDNTKYRVRVADGNSLDARFGDIDSSFMTLSTPYWGTSEGASSETVGPSVGEFENINNEGNDFNDYTSSAEWRTWKIVYDHVKKEISGYIDNIFIGSERLRIGNLSAGSRAFIGLHGDSNLKFSLKDFQITYDSLYYQEDAALTSEVTATISGSEAHKATDGDTSTVYVAPSPDSNTHIRLDFENPIDLAFYTLKQRDKDVGTVAYGVTTYYPNVARAALVDFGGLFTVVHNYPDSDSTIIRAPTFSGTAVVASGIEYLDFNFILYDDTEYSNGALVIEELQAFSEQTKPATLVPKQSDIDVSWSEGVFHNIKIYGPSSSLSLRDKRSLLIKDALPEYAVEGVNYGFSSARISEELNKNFVDSYHNASELFFTTGKVENGDNVTWKSLSQTDNHIFAWTYFEESSVVSSVYWNSLVLEGDSAADWPAADKFKFQYLVEGGDPQIEADWANFLPVSVPHPYDETESEVDGTYKDYKDYLIANNDGEFYTDYFEVPDTTHSAGTFYIGWNSTLSPTGISVPSDYMAGFLTYFHQPSVRLIDKNSSRGTNAATGYIEFDTPVRTRGFRMVVHSVKLNGTGDSADWFALNNISIFRNNSAGSYTSPVFDTGTKQNTERLAISAETLSGTEVRMFVRSHDEPPVYQHNNSYEFWEADGKLGNDQVPVSVGTKPYMGSQVLGEKVYFFFEENPYIYDRSSDSWSIAGGGYPGTSSATPAILSEPPEGESSASVPTQYEMDTVVRPNTALAGTKIYTAARTVSNVSTVPRIMYYDTVLNVWGLPTGNRPTFAENASMVSSEDGTRLYFFADDGTISYYEISTNSWVLEDVTLPSPRDTGCIVRVGGKIYILGGENGTVVGSWRVGTNICSTFDTASKEVTSISSSPYNIYRGNAIYVEEHRCIYVLPHTNATSSVDAPMKYFIDEDRWEVVDTLLSFREAGVSPGSASPLDLYYKQDSYIYGISSLETNPGRKTLVVDEPWQSGKSPSFKDSVWGSSASSNITWEEVGSFGEFMPQERFFQFKTELHSYGWSNSPVVNSVRVVQPQDVTIPASGTSNIYVKLGSIPDKSYKMWYSASDYAAASGTLSMFYTTSTDGTDWSQGTTVSGVWVTGGTNYNTVTSSWTIKNDVSDYQHWFSVQTSQPKILLDVGHSIRYSSSSVPESFSGDVATISGGEISQTGNGAFHPCVLKNASSAYDIWYTGKDSFNIKRIIHASSADGVSWSAHAVSLDKGTAPQGYDSAHAYRPSLLKEGEIYKMWYTGTNASGTNRILYTESSDGFSWGTPVAAVLPTAAGVETSGGVSDAVVSYDGTQYIMLYLGTDGVFTYGLRSISPDGLVWSDHSVIIPAGAFSEEQDSNGPSSVSFLVDVEEATLSSVFTSAKIKLHNEGASL
jgi:hypothetical protein